MLGSVRRRLRRGGAGRSAKSSSGPSRALPYICSLLVAIERRCQERFVLCRATKEEFASKVAEWLPSFRQA